MLESLKIIFDETLSVYHLATLDGRLFIPFIVCVLYLLFAPGDKHSRARRYFVYPTLILCVFIFNPVFIHYMIKFTYDPERVARMYWPLPIAAVIVYCVMSAFYALSKRWQRGALLACSLLVLLLITEGSHAGISFKKAENPEKLIPGAKEICDAVYNLSEGEEATVLVPSNLFFWVREYNAGILTPYKHKADEFMYTDDGELDLDATGEKALEAECDYVVYSSSAPALGSLEDYGYVRRYQVYGDNCVYYIYGLQ